MRRTKIALSLIVLLICVAISAEEKKDTSTETKAGKKTEAAEKQDQAPAQSESPLVRAAREGKAKRGEEKSRITITNKDVEKSSGKLIQSTNKPLEPLPQSTPTDEDRKKVADANARKASRAELQAKVDSYQKTVTDLEKELRRIEETYYNEDDPDFREDVLAMNFEDTRKQLDAARKELADARKALAATGSD